MDETAELGLLADVHRELAVAVLSLIDDEGEVLLEAVVEEACQPAGEVGVVRLHGLRLAQVIKALLREDRLEDVAVDRGLDD